MRIIKKGEIESYQKIFKRSGQILEDIDKRVSSILSEVKERGDNALLEFTERFDNVKLDDLRGTQEEIQKAYKNVSPELLDAIRLSIENQRKFQESIYNKSLKKINTMDGINVWREFRAIQEVGLYVPGGRAYYPSSVIMVGVPAKVSGCERLIVTTPPSSDGAIRDSVLVAANEVGVDEIYKLGGAQAIGAMAFGSESIIPVSKVFGAGNTYVTSAKMQVFGDVDIDMPAGPSEVMVIADDSADARYIAADLISQCEHGEESAAVLITDSADFAEKVSTQTVKQANELRTGETIIKSLNNYGAIILVEDINDSVEIANDYAPEHLEIVTRNYNQISKEIKNAGSIFLGEYSSEPAGDYATGTNHVLPTNGYAKMFSGLSIDSFGKWIQFQELTKEGLDKIRSAVDTLAEEENLPAHANAVNIRFEEDE